MEESDRRPSRLIIGDTLVNLARVITAHIREALKVDGFRPRAPEILTKIIDRDDYGWLGLNLTSRKKIVELNLVVGVRNEQLEAFISELMGVSIFGKFAPTVSTHIGYLMPERAYRPVFFDSEPRRNQIEAIAASVRNFAIPFMNKNASLTALSQRLRDPLLAHHDQVMYRLPACCFLLGNRGCAMALSAEYIEQIADRRDAAAEQYRVFAAALGRASRLYDA